MNAREYTLVNYFYAICKVFVGFTLCSFSIGRWMGLSLLQCLIIPLFVAGAKITFASKALWDYEKTGTVKNVVTGIFSIHKIITFKNYWSMYKELMVAGYAEAFTIVLSGK